MMVLVLQKSPFCDSLFNTNNAFHFAINEIPGPSDIFFDTGCL